MTTIVGEQDPNRSMRSLLVTTVLLPLLLVALGVWEWQRAGPAEAALVARKAQVERAVVALAARPAPTSAMPDFAAQFARDGQLYGGELALAQAREECAALDRDIVLARVRRVLPPVTMACAGLLAALSALALGATIVLARAARRSREMLIRGFDAIRRSLPPLMAAQVLLGAAAFWAAVGFEAFEIPNTHYAAFRPYLFMMVALAIGASLWTAIKTVARLRRLGGLFDPVPFTLAGRSLSREAAPGLWRLVDGLATRLGVSQVDAVVVGLSPGFFVSDAAIGLQPGDHRIEGRTLYLPMTSLPLLRADETSAIVAHELAHFAGGDLDYSRRFMPIYAGVQRSQDAIVRAGVTRQGTLSLLIVPAVRLILFVMERFDHAVQHWSRVRELAADAASLQVCSADAAARALLRVGPVRALTQGVLAHAFDRPETTPGDIVAAVVDHALAGELAGAIDDAEEGPRPTDSHPTTHQRLAALGIVPTLADLVAAVAPPPADALARLDTLFAEPRRVCERLTWDFLAAARVETRAFEADLVDTAGAVGPDPVALYENSAPRGRFLMYASGVFFLVALAFALYPIAGIPTPYRWICVGTAGACGLSYIPLALFAFSRGRAPFLILGPDAMAIAGLDRSIGWDEIEEMNLSTGPAPTRMVIEIAPGAPFPGRPPGRRMTRDCKRRTITLAVPPPVGMTRDEVPHLVARYFHACHARQTIAERAAGQNDYGSGR
ncbi:peptidase M48-like protein [Sphingomonas sp. PP-CE-3G-477]|uniref:M48 family metallopeptidase n=1 Tax=Sphingomonas sp. PP-CE-3G-477 TaxID=2135660 RepID=UPI000D3B0F69|nr:M48 family metallopeptidase [Sphingomonas sp. PP-CE-3G-477]PTQ60086.1 peptidase M48-like protein [Sphingomonas sp. PP-CE-3G-477]